MLSFGFVGSVILDNAIFCSPAVLSALSSFYLFVLLKIDHFCSEDDGAKIRYFLHKNPGIILYLGLFSVLSFLIVQPMFPYFEWMLKRFDLDDFIHVGVYGSSYRKYSLVLFILNYLLHMHNIVYSVPLVWKLNKTCLLKSSQKLNINLCYIFLLVATILILVFHFFILRI